MIGQAILVIAIIAGTRALKVLNPYNSNSPRMRLFRGMAYGCISGILSAHSLLVAKSAVELLVRTIVDGKNQFNRFPSWMILLGLIALALSQLYYLHRGLKLCSTSILYPFVFCVYNIIAILDGLIYFHQTSRLSLLAALLVSLPSLSFFSYTYLDQIALGTIILLTGVVCLSWRLNNDAATKPAGPHTAITPGMGLLPPDSDSDSLSSPTIASDEESRLLLPRSVTLPTKSSQLPTYGAISKGKRNVRYVSNPLVTANTNPSASPSRSPRRPRRKTVNEADEIWNELEDSSTPRFPPFSRRVSTGARHLTPSRLRPGSSSSATGTPAVQGRPSIESHSSLPTPKLLDESAGPLARSATGRLYRDRRRRRSVLGNETSASRREGTRRASQQQAVGGWWKMKRWWKGSTEKGKDRLDDHGAGGGGGGDGRGEGGGGTTA